MNSFEGLDWLLIHHVDVDFVVDICEVFRLAKTKARNINSLENGKQILKIDGKNYQAQTTYFLPLCGSLKGAAVEVTVHLVQDVPQPLG